MLYGMGTVFVFLTVMVFVLMLLAWLVKKFPGAPSVEPSLASQPPVSAEPTNHPVDPSHLKAIEQALKLFRQS